MDAATAYRRRWATLVVLCACLLVIGLDNTILNVALPTLSQDLGATSSQLQWIVDSYTLVFAGLVLTAGSLGDRFGRRTALIGGLGLFGAASFMAVVSQSPAELIAARALMGVGGAFIMPTTLSVLTNTFPDATERARAIGIWAAVAALGIVVGPALGGWLLTHFWWGSVFLVNVPVVTVGAVAAAVLVPNSKDPSKPRLDPLGAVLSVLGLVSLVWAIIGAPDRGWTAPATLGALALSAGVLAAFVAWELRVTQPMLDLRFFRDARFSASSFALSLASFAMFGATFLLTQYMQLVLGYDPLGAGIRVLPIAAIVLGAPIAIRISQRVGSKVPVVLGMTCLAGAALVLSTCDAMTGYGRVATALAMIGVGLGMTMAPATDAIMTSLPAAKAGVGSAVNDANRLIGGSLGVAVLGSILASGFADDLSRTAAGQPLPAGATEGIGPAFAAAGSLPADAAQALHTAAGNAFVHGMQLAMLVSAAVAVVGALVAARWLPARAPAPVADVEDPIQLVSQVSSS